MPVLMWYLDVYKRQVYNDWKMDGLKYSNVGDIVVINPNDYVNYWGYNMLKNGHAGLLDTDYINDGEALNTRCV